MWLIQAWLIDSQEGILVPITNNAGESLSQPGGFGKEKNTSVLTPDHRAQTPIAISIMLPRPTFHSLSELCRLMLFLCPHTSSLLI